MSAADEAIPKDVRSWMRSLRDVGLEPDAVKVSDRWLVIVSTEHAEMRLELEHSVRGRWEWADSTLTVDGVPRARAEGARDLARIIRRANGQKGSDVPTPMPPARPPSEAPPAVQMQYYAFVRRTDMPVAIGGEGGLWMLGIDTDRGAIRMLFRRIRKGRYARGMQVIIDGEDRSEEVGEDLAAAVALMASAGQSDAPKDIGAPAGPPRRTPAETRKGTVMRN
jgi:hypothetical protein